MSGHSKWAQIKRKKAVTDAKKGAVFTKLARELTQAAREGGGDLEANFTLRLVVDKARAANMPKENIERSIQRGTGELKGVSLEQAVYEGYGPGGTALIVEVLTDNRNRAVSEIRRLFTRYGGNLGESGSVAWMFDRKGIISAEGDGLDPEEIALLAIDAGAEDVNIDAGAVEVNTAPADLVLVRNALTRTKVPVESAELSMVPKSRITPDEHETFQAMRLIEALEELEDVQAVFSNLEIGDELMAKYEEENG
jgi:YebC/PmpR family DNA-binding regulatory protein